MKGVAVDVMVGARMPNAPATALVGVIFSRSSQSRGSVGRGVSAALVATYGSRAVWVRASETSLVKAPRQETASRRKAMMDKLMGIATRFID